ncbi:MAG: class I SAM-dependent methyltransferase [Proteobacteria bacterium]|nr:class I SAM-dependent methyltransferase [Pseudomonadota bacterium]HQR05067.1 class I SAM-dependent methyltransferase [Rhodocyclaceae bacterium]
MSPFRKAIAAQILALPIAYAIIQIIQPRWGGEPGILGPLLGFCAATVGYKLEIPSWWIPINLAFPSLTLLALGLHLPPVLWLTGFGGLVLVFWRVDKNRVPLYLSNEATANTLLTLLPPHPCRFLDLGCGDGRLLRHLALARPDCEFIGIEHAPLPWLWARLRSARIANLQIRHGDLWNIPLGLYDLVYAFLSSDPMNGLWEKSKREMKPHALLISNSFPIPGVSPLQVIEVPDRRHTRIYSFHPGQAKNI